MSSIHKGLQVATYTTNKLWMVFKFVQTYSMSSDWKMERNIANRQSYLYNRLAAVVAV